MGGMTVKDLQEAKGKRTIAYVQVAREEEAIAASEAGMGMIGTAEPEILLYSNLQICPDGSDVRLATSAHVCSRYTSAASSALRTRFVVAATSYSLSRPNKPKRNVLKSAGSSHCNGTPAAI